jgi:hypothetical protein
MPYEDAVMHFVDVLKFFGCELGAQTKYDKTSGTCIVNGAVCNPAASSACPHQ